MRAALIKAKLALETLIAAIEQHHATHLCESMPLFAEADRQYRVLQIIRLALSESED